MSTKSSKPKKEKSKISKLIEKSDSENDENEHELSFYMNDRVKLMKEVLKIIKPKKIKSMAPDCIKDLDIEEINSMLLEELLGISNKRLQYIFTGQNLGEDSSSTDTEEEKQQIDIISLDDVSDDDFAVEVDSDNSRNKRAIKIKEEPKVKKIKKEKSGKKKQKDGPLEEENLMSVLELLELQARARAIRSQLMLEANKKNAQPEVTFDDSDDDNDAVIIETPKNEEIVINSSDSETGEPTNPSPNINNEKPNSDTNESQRKKITLIRDRVDIQKPCSSAQEEKVSEITTSNEEVNEKNTESLNEPNNSENKISEKPDCSDNKAQNESNKSNVQDQEHANDDDEIILIVDQDEMDRMIGD